MTDDEQKAAALEMWRDTVVQLGRDQEEAQ
jgi:hypothetical protein